jgi:ELMO domain-containing protein
MFQRNSFLAIREKKAALKQEIEKMRLRIEVVDSEAIESERAQRADENDKKDDENESWLSKTNALVQELDELKLELTTLRLLGDEASIVHNGRKQMIEITADSIIAFSSLHYTATPLLPADMDAVLFFRVSAVEGDDSECERLYELYSDDGMLFEVRMAQRVRDVADLAVFRPLPWNQKGTSMATAVPSSSPSSSSSSSSLHVNASPSDAGFNLPFFGRVSFFDDNGTSSSSSSLAASSSSAMQRQRIDQGYQSTPTSSYQNSSMPRAFEIVWKSGTPRRDVFVTQEHGELEEVLLCHLNRYRARFVERVEGLKARFEDSRCPYDATNGAHEDLLMALWRAVKPDTKLEDRISSQWKQIGFQGTDPATDFRGMGVLGLRNLLFFAENYGPHVRTILRGRRSYPLAATGINISALLFRMLGLTVSLVAKPASADEWDTPMLRFFCHSGTELAFEECYVQLFFLFDALWTSSNAAYMDFPNVVAETERQMNEMLSNKHVYSIVELKNKVNQQVLLLKESVADSSESASSS